MRGKKRGWLIAGGAALAAALVLCAWIYGWGGGAINVMEVRADEVERLELFSTDLALGLDNVIVTEKEDMQALIDSVNAFRYTGSPVKEVLRYGIGAGGTVLYTCSAYLSNGEEVCVNFGSNSRQPKSDMEVSYWTSGKQPSQGMCRGSMEVFCELYEKYRDPDSFTHYIIAGGEDPVISIEVASDTRRVDVPADQWGELLEQINRVEFTRVPQEEAYSPDGVSVQVKLYHQNGGMQIIAFPYCIYTGRGYMASQEDTASILRYIE